MASLAYYNENDPKAAAWLRELVRHGHIAFGVVDDRSIEDVVPAEVAHFAQCHFFAGIGAWSLALRQGGWPDDRPAWTASLPCQPFSAAGQRGGFADERHLWPVFLHLLTHGKHRTVPVLGEQVANRGGLEWLDLVSADMERAGYAVGAADICAAGFGAPHLRQRLYWLADGVADADEAGRDRQRRARLSEDGDAPHRHDTDGRGEDGHRPGPVNGHWADGDWIFCRDGKWRPVEPGTQPLASGAPARVGLLRGYGNSLCVPQAAAFVRAARAALDGAVLS